MRLTVTALYEGAFYFYKLCQNIQIIYISKPAGLSLSYPPAGAKVNSVRFHEIALHHAARVDMVDMVELLMEFGANAYASDNLGKKPVDYTAPGSTTHTCLMFYESKLCFREL